MCTGRMPKDVRRPIGDQPKEDAIWTLRESDPPIVVRDGNAGTSVMARGDGGKTVFETDDDRKSFVFRLGQVCGSHGWRMPGCSWETISTCCSKLPRRIRFRA